jgi:CRISPR/Cas system CMR subunit Cmr4 (Cas7 group RAMP superfamily)
MDREIPREKRELVRDRKRIDRETETVWQGATWSSCRPQCREWNGARPL